jgi:hypothetical protein
MTIYLLISFHPHFRTRAFLENSPREKSSEFSFEPKMNENISVFLP